MAAHPTNVTSIMFRRISRSRGETFVVEFFGGRPTQLIAGNGTVSRVTTTTDDFRQHLHHGQVTTSGVLGRGRWRSAICPARLQLRSAFYIKVTSSKAPSPTDDQLGLPLEGRQIDYTAATAKATWQRSVDFKLIMKVSISSKGGVVGIPAACWFLHPDQRWRRRDTYSLRQVLDTYVFGTRKSMLHGE
jgi:hypothetical protein